ncbi:CPBP family glutamic-type intramembrane protease [Shewanella dokdonensis]|uniref:CPBP family intramembrane metalloprotease n=1 Tax=Shewanella dokdonensis TaxID=712036 RepID=A0ABX8DGQ5_9GAMM|nr:CPBP family glutamic-type intramembrane protease [Shewanella dokdonensis]MCL1074110.1 CPBP family glutamic-type intramembrane protease [Shewanella dokdonensis]QVK23850.1 CPBP family intramembrane metalloprotease [Shewanella dokdonensis]
MIPQYRFNWPLLWLLFLLGIIGALSLLPTINTLLSTLTLSPSIPQWALLLLSVFQTALLLFCALMLGNWCSVRVNLSAPLFTIWLAQRYISWSAVKAPLWAAIRVAILCSVLLLCLQYFAIPRLPADFVANGSKLAPPLYSRLLYGGLTEELLVRWGAMSFLLWLFYRMFCGGRATSSCVGPWLSIVVSALLFGLGHLPAALMLTSAANPFLVTYLLLGNGIFGIAAGWLFWRYGLEAAVMAHMLIHLLLYVGS